LKLQTEDHESQMQKLQDRFSQTQRNIESFQKKRENELALKFEKKRLRELDSLKERERMRRLDRKRKAQIMRKAFLTD